VSDCYIRHRGEVAELVSLDVFRPGVGVSLVATLADLTGARLAHKVRLGRR
jgi:hypothetical protein